MGTEAAARQRAQRKYRELNIARGLPSRIPAGPVRAHLTELSRAGLSWVQIQEWSGVRRQTISKIMDPSYGRVATETALALLCVEVPLSRPSASRVPPGRTVPARGTVRRLKALAVMGYTNPAIGRESELSAHRISEIVNRGERSVVKAKTAQAVTEFYRRAVLSPAPSGAMALRTANRARALGWDGPGAWDDPDTDEFPAASGPHGDLIDLLRRHGGRVLRSELGEELMLLLDAAPWAVDRMIQKADEDGVIVRVRTKNRTWVQLPEPDPARVRHRQREE